MTKKTTGKAHLLSILSTLKPASGKMYLFKTSSNHYQQDKLQLLKMFAKKSRGIYMSASIPCSRTRTDFEGLKIPVSNMFVIDMIGEHTGLPRKGENCAFISSPASLTETSIALNEKMMTREYGYVLLDSASALLVFNTVETVARFLIFIMQKIRYYNMTGIVLFLEDEKSKKLFDQVVQFFDECVSCTKS